MGSKTYGGVYHVLAEERTVQAEGTAQGKSSLQQHLCREELRAG